MAKLMTILAVLLGLAATTVNAADYSAEAAAWAIQIQNQSKVKGDLKTPWIINKSDPFSPANQTPQGYTQVCTPQGCYYVPIQNQQSRMVQVCSADGTCYYVPTTSSTDSESWVVTTGTATYTVAGSQVYTLQGRRFVSAGGGCGVVGNPGILRGGPIRRLLFWRR